MKRIFDICVAVTVLVTGAPIIVLIAFLVRLNLGSPILFVQQRPGLHGQPFDMVKFRTMRDSIDKAGKPLPDHLRLTRFGAFLRASSLDELPELWNVLRGEMSIVGPRPLLMEYLPLYSSEQFRRHDVKPGITGWAQVNGRNAISWEQKFMLDVWYVDHISFLVDLKIIMLTFRKVFVREGISADGHVTIERFKGSRQ
jgi:lipopolysaccharide/colanic/teichoic acid biosynthesis glycosyltransferase